MTENQELKAKALELAINLYSAESEEVKTAVFIDANAGKKENKYEAIVLGIANNYLKYISYP